ncbi:MAG TPA: tyrosine-type recombinase/integrase, partial [Bacteroidales bacterium]|nr:tyrosine-type recombinase/integrase [Bacteroidales bacterium]
RRSEIINLKITDFNPELKVSEIRNSKRAKDRIIPITDPVMNFIRDYYREFKPRLWLFEGAKSGQRYSVSVLQQFFIRAKRTSDINKKTTLHSLRCSFTTWHLE